MFTVRYEHGHDRINGDYNTVGGFVTVGFQLENLLSFQSPVTMPEPVFKSPRDLRRLLGLKVKRNWHQPEAVVLARAFANPPPPALVCTNLQGLVLITNQLDDGQLIFAGQIPPLTNPETVEFCWCGSQYAGLVSLLIRDGSLGPELITTMTLGSGCVTVTLPAPLNITANHVQVGLPVGVPINFDPGGGISLLFP